jgi:hypothetical protein
MRARDSNLLVFFFLLRLQHLISGHINIALAQDHQDRDDQKNPINYQVYGPRSHVPSLYSDCTVIMVPRLAGAITINFAGETINKNVLLPNKQTKNYFLVYVVELEGDLRP